MGVVNSTMATANQPHISCCFICKVKITKMTHLIKLLTNRMINELNFYPKMDWWSLYLLTHVTSGHSHIFNKKVKSLTKSKLVILLNNKSHDNHVTIYVLYLDFEDWEWFFHCC